MTDSLQAGFVFKNKLWMGTWGAGSLGAGAAVITRNRALDFLMVFLKGKSLEWGPSWGFQLNNCKCLGGCGVIKTLSLLVRLQTGTVITEISVEIATKDRKRSTT